MVIVVVASSDEVEVGLADSVGVSLVPELGGTGPMELSVVNLGEELSISVEKVEVPDV